MSLVETWCSRLTCNKYQLGTIMERVLKLKQNQRKSPFQNVKGPFLPIDLLCFLSVLEDCKFNSPVVSSSFIIVI
jgi:hypothetical protein